MPPEDLSCDPGNVSDAHVVVVHSCDAEVADLDEAWPEGDAVRKPSSPLHKGIIRPPRTYTAQPEGSRKLQGSARSPIGLCQAPKSLRGPGKRWPSLR